jgi:hypothetical protein
MMQTKLILTFLVASLTSLAAQAQIQTLVVTPSNTNSAVITVSSNAIVKVLAWSQESGGDLLVNMQGVNFEFNGSYMDLSKITFAGPGTIQLRGDVFSPYWVTVNVEPGPFPPGRTATVGSYSGNVQVTLQMSTDLVNWTPAVNGMVYTNCPDARFFRIQLLTNAQGP